MSREIHERIDEIEAFLSRYQGIWSREVVAQFPYDEPLVSDEWSALISNLDPDDISTIECRRGTGSLPEGELKSMLEENFALSSFYTHPQSPDADLPGPSRTSGVSQKKQHEIDTLLELVEPHFQRLRVAEVFDFCGGMGHFAAAAVSSFNVKATTFDFSEELQGKGKQRYVDLCSDSRIRFAHADVRQSSSHPLIPRLSALDGQRSAIGLHTCGDLAQCFVDAVIEAEIPLFFSVPCCYYKGSTNTQSFSEDEPTLSPEALWLASRSHCQVNIGGELGYRVKYFRFMMHLYLCEVCGIREFVGLGHSTKTLYRAGFEEYAEEQLRRLAVENPSSHRGPLREFSRRSSRIKIVKEMIASSVIRNSFGRLIEVLIVLRRAAKIGVRGYAVSVEACFDERVSPRNLLITARK